jgi:flavin-dependent dehydrogenase
MRKFRGAILGGDAAAVADPYMGEGISRALGTGPLLERALAAHAGRPLSADALRSAYQELWKERYTRRLRLGAVTRHLLRRPRLFHGALGVVVGRPRLMRSVTRVFHPAIQS